MGTYFEFLNRINNKETSSLEETKFFLENIKANSNLNAFLTINEEEAIKSAQESDKRFNEGNPRKIEGMVVALKDNLSTKNIKTTCGSKILENFIPVYDATVIERIKAEGGIIIGKTNMDEFAMGSSNENSAYGDVSNNFDLDRVPGGSSGGSAVAVSANLCHVSLGSDTGGSIRQPAAFTGTYGIKPTYGRISRYGLITFASSLDQIGIFSKNVEDMALMIDIISGKDEMDSTTSDIQPTNSFDKINEANDKFTIGVLPYQEMQSCNLDVLKAYKECLSKLQEDGHQIVEIELKNSNIWIPTYYILATAETSSNIARFDGVKYGFRAHLEENDDFIVKSRSLGFGEEVKRRIMLGTFVLSSGYYDAYYAKAQKARRLIQDNYKEIFNLVDFLFLPTTPTTPFKKGEKTADPIAMYLSDYFTTSANLAGVPAISIPVGFNENGLPIGMQVQMNNFEDEKLLNVSNFLTKLFK